MSTTRRAERVGIDANRPIDPRTGAIQPQVADPDVIASTGAGWVRLNFVLGPWSGPEDPTLHDGRTWAQAYGQIIAGLRSRGLRIYGLIGCEAMPSDPGDRYRTAPAGGDAGDEWLDQYVGHLLAIATLFRHDVQVIESFNEPDDWHGQQRNWIHPAWFAILLHRIYRAVRGVPELDPIRLVSGPLQGLETNRNAAATYLTETYRFGKTWLGWGEGGVPFPFDGVGYHLYVKPAYHTDRALQERVVQATCRRYLDAMHQVIRRAEGRDKPLYVSEMGWSSSIDYRAVQGRELFQAHSLQVGLQAVLTDPLVALGCWFCTQDFPSERHDSYYGLYRLGTPGPENRKPAFGAFRALCRQAVPPERTDRPLIASQQLPPAELAQRGTPTNVLAAAGPGDHQARQEGPALAHGATQVATTNGGEDLEALRRENAALRAGLRRARRFGWGLFLLAFVLGGLAVTAGLWAAGLLP